VSFQSPRGFREGRYWDRHDQGDEIADMRRQVNQILHAVKAVVPQSM
jgi:hypothetical protein